LIFIREVTLLKKIFEKLAEVLAVKSGPASQHNLDNGINLQNMSKNDTVKLLVEVLSSDYDKMVSKGAKGKLFVTSPEGVGYLTGFIDGFMQGLDPHNLKNVDENHTTFFAVLALINPDLVDSHKVFQSCVLTDPSGLNASAFLSSTQKGGSYGKALAGRKSEAGWYQHFVECRSVDEELEPQKDIENEFTGPDLKQKDQHADELMHYFIRAVGNNSQDELPEDFFRDRYLAGFATGYLAIVADAILGGLNWSTEEKGAHAIKFLSTFGSEDKNLAIQLLGDKQKAFEVSRDGSFVEGRDHGSLLAVTHYDKLKKDLSEPLIDACKNLSNSTGITMQDAVFALTLQKYVLMKWPNSVQKIKQKVNKTDPVILNTIHDFSKRIDQVDNAALASLLLQVNEELQGLFSISPTSESWFLELDDKHSEDLQNLQAVTWLKIQAGQADADFSGVAKHILILLILTGIINDEATEIAYETWRSIKDRTEDLLKSQDHQQLPDIMNNSVSQARFWTPDALVDKYFNDLMKD